MPAPQPMLRWLSAGLFLAGLALAALHQSPLAAPEFDLAPARAPVQQPASLLADQLPVTAAVSAPVSLTLLADGRIAAAWLASPADDTAAGAIWLAFFSDGRWSMPQLAATLESVAAGSFARVSQLGRPVIYAEGSWLHLWLEALPLDGWAAASIVHSVSTDGGKSWSRAARLQSSPLGALGSRLSGPPISLRDGGLGLPIAPQFPAGHTEWLRLTATGQIASMQRLPGQDQLAALLASNSQQALAIMANGAVAMSNDGGNRWQRAEMPGMPALAGAAALLRLSDGQLLLAGNPAGDRQILQLWLSADDGQRWSTARTLEKAADGAGEFTAPSLLRGRDGRIHLAYTWRQRGIKHLVFSEAWLAGKTP